MSANGIVLRQKCSRGQVEARLAKMRDRICRIDENLLQRTAGPYIRVMNVAIGMSTLCPLLLQEPT
jgi:hypothetical protein